MEDQGSSSSADEEEEREETEEDEEEDERVVVLFFAFPSFSLSLPSSPTLPLRSLLPPLLLLPPSSPLPPLLVLLPSSPFSYPIPSSSTPQQGRKHRRIYHKVHRRPFFSSLLQLLLNTARDSSLPTTATTSSSLSSSSGRRSVLQREAHPLRSHLSGLSSGERLSSATAVQKRTDEMEVERQEERDEGEEVERVEWGGILWRGRGSGVGELQTRTSGSGSFRRFSPVLSRNRRTDQRCPNSPRSDYHRSHSLCPL